ncbi:MAG: hypothetical protein ACOC2H_02535 [Spirochaetota bacterium]
MPSTIIMNIVIGILIIIGIVLVIKITSSLVKIAILLALLGVILYYLYSIGFLHPVIENIMVIISPYRASVTDIAVV